MIRISEEILSAPRQGLWTFLYLKGSGVPSPFEIRCLLQDREPTDDISESSIESLDYPINSSICFGLHTNLEVPSPETVNQVCHLWVRLSELIDVLGDLWSCPTQLHNEFMLAEAKHGGIARHDITDQNSPLAQIS